MFVVWSYRPDDKRGLRARRFRSRVSSESEDLEGDIPETISRALNYSQSLDVPFAGPLRIQLEFPR